MSDNTKLAFFSPMVINRCLRKSIGQHEFCKPIRNGNLIAMCKFSNHIKTLLKQYCFSDTITGTSILILASLLKLTEVNGMIYNVPLNVFNDN